MKGRRDEHWDYLELPYTPWVDGCPLCGYDGPAVKLDFGIGTYEFWGTKCVDRREAWVCPRCETPIEE